MKLPELTVVMPNYNHAKLLPTSVQAILDQSVPPTEFIIIDDASTDNSVEVIESFAKKYPCIRFYRNEKNRGVIHTQNRGLELARCPYITFHAADDQVLPGFFEKSLMLLAQHPQAALSCGIADLYEVDTGLNWHLCVGTADSACYLSPEEIVAADRRGRFLLSANTAIQRRACILELGVFMPELKWHSDWFMVYVTALRYGLCYIPETLGRFNIHSKSFYKAGRADRAAHRAVLERIMELLTSKEYEQEAELIREGGMLYQFDWTILSILLRNKRYRRFITPTFLRKNLWHSTQLLLKPFTPAFLGNLYFKIAGLRASPNPPTPPTAASAPHSAGPG